MVAVLYPALAEREECLLPKREMTVVMSSSFESIKADQAVSTLRIAIISIPFIAEV